jgi:hypothetical protein
MSWMPEPEPTPLRLRLGPRSEVPLRQPFALDYDETGELVVTPETVLTADERVAPANETDPENVETAQTVKTVELPTEAAIDSKEALRNAAREELQRAVDETARRVDRWMADQRRRLTDGLDAMLVQLKEQRQFEAASLEVWKISERERAERELAEEKERFHMKLMEELVAFEHQLGERLREQEERLTRWWDEAEQLATERFASLGLSARSETGEPPKESVA